MPHLPHLDLLNPEQREAAQHFEGPLLVLAGAGSGKTRVLTTRIAHLVDEFGVAPESILALTFTNKAAGEMRERIRQLLGRDPGGMWMGTFHAVGARMLRRDAPRLGWSPNFLIYDADDSERIIKRIIKEELNLDPKRWSPRAVKTAISSAKNELVGVQEYQEQALDPFTRTVGQVYERYQRVLRDANAFDFDDLLVKPVELLRAFPDVLRRYQQRFHFVLVDEYQDTNRAQYVFLRMIVGDKANLFVVGDDDQSIYGWRGADIRNILDFEKDFPDAGLVRLEENYRSTQRILEAANRVIAENVRRKGKTLRTGNAEGERITLVEVGDEGDEADWISSEIRARMAIGPARTPRDFVILYRTNAQSRALEEALRREGLPYRIVGGQRFYERREVKDVLAYLRLVANPADDEAFLRIVNVPRRGIGDASLARLAEWARENGQPLLASAARVDEIDTLRGAASASLSRFADLVRKLAAFADKGIALDELLRMVVSESGLVESLREEGPDGEERIANVDELLAGAAELQVRIDQGDPEILEEMEGAESLRAIDLFLAHVALVTDIDQHDPDADAVSLMTLHNAKGLEFPVVFLSGMEEGLFPLSRVFDEPEQLEEERRLFYVGITRAEEKLYLVSARRRRRGREWMDSVPSSFLESIPRELLEIRQSARLQERFSPRRPWRTPDFVAPARRRVRLGLDAPAEPGETRHVDYADSQDQPRLIKGARVRHPQFGSGTVVELSGAGLDVKATIDFETVGRKRVVVRYANLQSDWE
ncbi:MAG TPA: UvrD-helicase domain-containing protein [Longimicrobiaceae bacterium]|nr:UvrD-helicase domain-containing protein [Longimicrobiaceae bacterium]